jgi:argininosuccinate lyase
MYETAVEGYSTATDIAEYLVKKGLPFRKAHEITGRIVLYCISKKKKLGELTLRELNRYSPLISDDIYLFLRPEESVKAKKSTGSTSPDEVRKQIKRLMRRFGDMETR